MPWSKNRCWFPWYAYCLLNPHICEYYYVISHHIPYLLPSYLPIEISSLRPSCLVHLDLTAQAAARVQGQEDERRRSRRQRRRPWLMLAAHLSSGSIYSCWWLMSTPDKTKPLFINWGGIPPIVMIWYLNGTFPIKQPFGVYWSRVDSIGDYSTQYIGDYWGL